MKTGIHGQLMTGGKRLSREKRNPKFKAVSGMPVRNHVFCTTELQKASGNGDDRYSPEVLEVETKELVV